MTMARVAAQLILGLVGLGGLLIAAFSAPYRVLGLGLGVIALFMSATLLSRASGLVPALRPFVNKRVRVTVWGSPLTGEFEVDSVAAFGAGLLIHLRTSTVAKRTLLKVAQPRSPNARGGRVEIGQAAYVSWAGKKLPRAGDPAIPAVVIEQVV